MAIEIRRPTGAGNDTELSYTGDTANYLCVDEAVADDDTTKVYIADDANYFDDYTIDSTSIAAGSTINSVTVYARIKTETITEGTNNINLLVSSTLYQSDDLIGSNEPYTNLSNVWNENPDTSSAWTVSSIDTFNIGVSLSYAHCTQVWVSVDYTEPTTTSTTSSSSSSTSSTTSSSSSSSSSTSTSSTSISTSSTSTTSSSSSTTTTSSSSSSTSTTSSSSSTTTTSSSSTSTTLQEYSLEKKQIYIIDDPVPQGSASYI